MPWSAVSLFICLLLPLSSSAPLSSHSDSSSDEERQLPAVFPVVGVASPPAPPTLSKAPPGVVVQVEDTKRNITLSFAIFIIPEEEEEEGSGTDGRGGSDENSSSRESDDITDDVSSEETRNQDVQPASSLPPSENLSSEEMMSDQPMFTSSDEQTDDFNNTAQSLSDDFIDTLTGSNVSQKLGVSDEFDDFNNSTESEEVYSQAAVTVPDDSDDKNNTRSDDFTDNTNREETAIDDSDDFNNNTETNNQPVRIIFDYFHDRNTISDEPTMSLSDDFSNSSSSEVSELDQNQQFVPLNPYNQTTMNSQQQISDMNKVDKLVLNPVVQEITSSSSEKTSSINQDKVGSSSGHINRDAGLVGSRLQEMFHSIPEVVDLPSANQGVVSRHKGLGSIPSSVPGSQKRLDSSDSEENSELFSIVSFNPKHQGGVGSDPDSDEIIKVSDGIQQGTGSRDSKKTVSKPKTSSTSDLFSLDSDSKEVEETSDESSQDNNTDGLNPVGPGLDPAPTILSIPKNTVSQRNSKKSPRSHLQVNVYLNSDSSEESLDSVGPQQEAGSGQGLSGLSSPEVSSSSEEVVLALASSSSPPPASSPVASQSEELDLSDSVTEPDPPGLDSETTELHPDPIPTSDSTLSAGFISNPGFGTNSSSEVSQSESDESLTTETPTDADAASLAASSADSMDVKLDDDVKDTEADLSLAGTTYSSIGINEAPTTISAYSASHTSMHVRSGMNTDANTDELSVEKDEASTEATAVSMKPTATTEYITNPVNLRASTDAIANVKKKQAGADVSTEANQDASSPGPKKPASSEENMASPLPPPPLPPRRKKPFRFGSFGPISYSYGNQPVVRETVAEEMGASSNPYTRREFTVHRQNKNSDPLRILFHTQYNVERQRHPQVVSHHANRKQLRVSVAAIVNPAESSSEETKK